MRARSTTKVEPPGDVLGSTVTPCSSRADYDALTETAWLLRALANARRLLECLERARTGRREVHDLD